MTQRTPPRDQSGRPNTVPARPTARLARLGRMVTGVAGRIALDGARQLGQGQRPSPRDLILSPANARRVTDELARMRGAAMKLGQLLSMDAGDLLPAELTDILARLRAQADFMPPAQLKKVLNDNWPKDWLHQVAHFDVHPIAAASIGQVHKVKLKDGRLLAVKVQYPGVARSIDSDLRNVSILIRLSGLLPKDFDMTPYLNEAARQLHSETDYLTEAAHLERFGALLGGDTRFALPQVQWDLTTAQTLAMTFLNGHPVEDLHPPHLRDQVMHDMFDLLLAEIFDYGLVQTDPNFANYRFDPETGRILLLDFGATRALPSDEVDCYRKLILAGIAGDQATLGRCIKQLGFINHDTAPEDRSAILAMASQVFDLLRGPGPVDFGTTDLARQISNKGMELARRHFIPPDPSMDALFLQRKLMGLFLLAAQLRSRVHVTELISKRLDVSLQDLSPSSPEIGT